MSDQPTLSEEERAELEQLRAEKAAREQAQAEAAERAELERLRAEQARAKAEAARSQAEQAEAARIAAERERGRKLMEPDEDDEDIKMPVGQKVVIGIVAFVAVVMVLLQLLGRR